jgi:ketosteroid isomerase-like protein
MEFRDNGAAASPACRSRAEGVAMDAQTNTALVKRALECIAAGDLASFLELLDEDIRWIIPDMPEPPFARTWTGREQVAQFFKVVDEAQEIIDFTPERYVAQDDLVVVLGRFANRVRATGKVSRSAWAQVWTVSGGKIASMREYVDTLAVNGAFLEGEG